MATKNSRWISLERELPSASPKFCAHLWNGLVAAGLRPDADEVKLIGQLVSHYIRDTQDGKETVFALLKTQVSSMSPLKTYFQSGHEGDQQYRIPATDLVEYRGYLHKRVKGVPHDMVSVIHKEELDGCDDCGALVPSDFCAKLVKTTQANGKEHLQTVCNHCRAFSQDNRVRDEASKRVCVECPKLGCQHHPKVRQMPLQLPAPAKTGFGF